MLMIIHNGVTLQGDELQDCEKTFYAMISTVCKEYYTTTILSCSVKHLWLVELVVTMEIFTTSSSVTLRLPQSSQDFLSVANEALHHYQY